MSDLAAFRETHDLPFELLSDEDGAVASAYDAYSEKNMFGRTFVVDPEGRIEHAFLDVSPERHADEILAALG